MYNIDSLGKPTLLAGQHLHALQQPAVGRGRANVVQQGEWVYPGRLQDSTHFPLDL